MPSARNRHAASLISGKLIFGIFGDAFTSEQCLLD